MTTRSRTYLATLKKEFAYRRSWPTRQELSSEVFEYIEGFYNLRRRHSTLGMLSPVEFEEQHASRVPTLARAENVNNVNGVLETLRLSNTNNDYYNDND